MIKITKEHIKTSRVYDFNVKELKQWLRLGLEEHFLEHDEDAFGDLYWFIGSQNDLVLELNAVYDVCEKRLQANWRETVSELICELPYTKEYFPILEFLIYFSGYIQATNLFKVLPQLINCGLGGEESTGFGFELYVTVFDVVAGMAEKNNVKQNTVVGIIESLIESTYFRKEHASFALIALCRADPNSLPKHIAILGNYISDIYSKNIQQDVYELGWQICDYVSLSIIAKTISSLDNSCSNSIQTINDNWLISSLLKGSNAPLKIDMRENAGKSELLYIKLTDDNLKKSEPLSLSLSWDLLDELSKYKIINWDTVEENPIVKEVNLVPNLSCISSQPLQPAT